MDEDVQHTIYSCHYRAAAAWSLQRHTVELLVVVALVISICVYHVLLVVVSPAQKVGVCNFVELNDHNII